MELNKSVNGKILNILNSNNTLLRENKMRIFHIYVLSRVNYLPTLIAILWDLASAWKTISCVIFKKILDHARLCKESAAALKAGFYHVILKPIVKIVERKNQ